jgi:hypothetical protein
MTALAVPGRQTDIFRRACPVPAFQSNQLKVLCMLSFSRMQFG